MPQTPPKTLRLGVVIPTRNRPGDLVRAVRSILRSDDPDFELLVVDQSDDESTAAVLEPLRRDDRVRLIRMNRVGIAAARNLGCRELEADVVAFTDDDCEVSPGWLAALRDVFLQDQHIALAFWVRTSRAL